MPIPAQNDFLLPFLNIVSSGTPFTRAQVLHQLTEQFNISEVEVQEMGGNHQSTLRNRVAWCDVYFVKAGFITKKQHISDALQDTFQITELGLNELAHNADKLTAGYLQSFY